MRAEEILETLTDDELREKADACFIQAENTQIYQHVGLSKQFQPISASERQRLLAEADFYLKALAWRSDARTSRRDFWMEVSVIVLIGVEIILSLVFGFLAISEGRQQAAILQQMNKNTADTAAQIQRAADAMTATLQVLQADRADRLAQQAKKPELALNVGHVPLLKPHATFTPTQETDTTVTYHLDLWNRGDITANRLYLRAHVSSKDVTAYSNPGALAPEPDQTDPSVQSFILAQVFLRSHSYFPVDITFAYQKGHAPFQVTFKTDSEESRTPTLLGVLHVNPRTPSK